MKVANSFLDAMGGQSAAALAESIAASNLTSRYGLLAANGLAGQAMRETENIGAALLKLEQEELLATTLGSVMFREAGKIREQFSEARFGQAATVMEQERTRQLLNNINGTTSAADMVAAEIARITPKNAIDALGGSLTTYQGTFDMESASKTLMDALGGATAAAEIHDLAARYREPALNSMLAEIDTIGSAMTSYKACEEAAAAMTMRNAFEEATANLSQVAEVIEPPRLDVFQPPLRWERPGSTFVEVFETKEARDDERHREQMAFAKQVAEENERRSAEDDRREAENDKRENAFKWLALRLTIIFGLAGVVAGVWVTIVTNFFG